MCLIFLKITWNLLLFGAMARNSDREVSEVWSQLVGSAFNVVPDEKLGSIFNELRLYPSSEQVDEMLQCAKKCRKRNTGLSLTFSEFCTFAAELKKCYEKGIPFPAQLSRLLERDGPDKKRKARKMSKGVPKNEIFLGGSCNPTTWRQDIAIPLLNNLGISYYNPQVSQWRQELIELEHQAKEAASILFYVLDNQTRNVVSIIEAAFFTGSRRKLVLVMTSSEPGNLINGEAISQIESNELRSAQTLLHDLVKKHGVSVFDNIPLAVSCAAQILRDGVNIPNLEYSDSIENLKRSSLIVSDKQIDLQEVFNAFDTKSSGEISFSDVCLAFQLLTKHKLSQAELKNLSSQVTGFEEGKIGDVKINFAQFCSILSELKMSVNTDDTESEKPSTSSLSNHSLSFLKDSSTNLFDRVLGWIIRWPNSILLKENNQCKDVCLVGEVSDSDLTITSHLKRNNVKLSVLKYPKNDEGISLGDNYQVLVFHIPSTTRGLSTMALACYYIGLGYEVVLSIQMMKKTTVIEGEMVSQTAISDYNRGRSYLSDIAKQESVPVFDSLHDALLCAIGKCISKNR